MSNRNGGGGVVTGELEKRIRDVLKITETEDEVWNVISPNPILDIVEEMTKEIEEWRQKHPCYVAEKQTERDYVDEDKFYEARDEWLHEGMTLLEKWLGLPVLF